MMMTHFRSRAARAARAVVLSLACSLLAAAPLASQETESDRERDARLARTGGALRAGLWEVQDLEEIDGASYSETPVVEGVYTKGLDRHLALENSIGFWRRTQSITQDDGLGGTTTDRVRSYIIPQFTGLTLYPFTGADARLEPYLNAGLGFAIGVDDRESSGGGLFGGGDDGLQFVFGFGLKGGLGLDLRLTRAFGLVAGGRYQWIRFFEELGGERTYRGFAMDGGITYRFQY